MDYFVLNYPTTWQGNLYYCLLLKNHFVYFNFKKDNFLNKFLCIKFYQIYVILNFQFVATKLYGGIKPQSIKALPIVT